ncbi:MAG: FAD-binding domain-containing protein, partial [Methylococcaceae bacterium]|nr:FAD-binding domain-containing protein [Methylococcaceae bacterium]
AAGCAGIDVFIKELAWREFYLAILHHFPNVLDEEFNPDWRGLPWDEPDERFERWKQGRTGFPIVDAGMRELNATGFMHNRVRMISAACLIQDLHIDWRLGERYFARHLIDYDPCVNNGNWQWAASTGCDAQPYFRIFNPWTQQQKFDPDCGYICHWLPELRQFPAEMIHRWDKHPIVCDYPAPIIDHAKESRIAKERYLSAANAADKPDKRPASRSRRHSD